MNHIITAAGHKKSGCSQRRDAWCLVPGDGEDRAGHLVWRWRVAGCQHRATGIISSSTNQYHADMEHMFDDVRSGDYNTWGRNLLLCPHRTCLCISACTFKEYFKRLLVKRTFKQVFKMRCLLQISSPTCRIYAYH